MMETKARAARSAAAVLFIPSYSFGGNKIVLISLENGQRATRRRIVVMLSSLERSFRGIRTRVVGAATAVDVEAVAAVSLPFDWSLVRPDAARR